MLSGAGSSAIWELPVFKFFEKPSESEMNRAIAYAVMLLAVMMLVGVDTSGLTGFLFLILFLFATIHILFIRRLPDTLWGNALLLILGPTALVCLARAILNRMTSLRVEGNWLSVFILIALIVYSWYMWQRWQNRRGRRVDQSQLRGSEREFIVPFDNHRAREVEPNTDDEQ